MSDAGDASIFLPEGTEVLHCDRDLLLISKPAGILSHPNATGPRRQAAFLGSYDEKRRSFSKGGETLYLLHRLDVETSGVLLAVRSEEIRDRMVELFASGAVLKRYQGLFSRTPGAREGIWRDHLIRRKGPHGIQTQVLPDQEPNSQLGYQVLRSLGPMRFGLLEIRLDTGRTHQIRVQAARRGMPVLGDRIYGDFHANREARKLLGLRRLFLHAETLGFPHPRTGRQLEVHSPLPEDLRRCLKAQVPRGERSPRVERPARKQPSPSRGNRRRRR